MAAVPLSDKSSSFWTAASERGAPLNSVLVRAMLAKLRKSMQPKSLEVAYAKLADGGSLLGASSNPFNCAAGWDRRLPSTSAVARASSRGRSYSRSP